LRRGRRGSARAPIADLELVEPGVLSARSAAARSGDGSGGAQTLSDVPDTLAAALLCLVFVGVALVAVLFSLLTGWGGRGTRWTRPQRREAP